MPAAAAQSTFISTTTAPAFALFIEGVSGLMELFEDLTPEEPAGKREQRQRRAVLCDAIPFPFLFPIPADSFSAHTRLFSVPIPFSTAALSLSHDLARARKRM